MEATGVEMEIINVRPSEFTNQVTQVLVEFELETNTFFYHWIQSEKCWMKLKLNYLKILMSLMLWALSLLHRILNLKFFLKMCKSSFTNNSLILGGVILIIKYTMSILIILLMSIMFTHKTNVFSYIKEGFYRKIECKSLPFNLNVC